MRGAYAVHPFQKWIRQGAQGSRTRGRVWSSREERNGTGSGKSAGGLVPALREAAQAGPNVRLAALAVPELWRDLLH
jgi:hypothetical protein